MSRGMQRRAVALALAAALVSASALTLRAAAPELTVTYYYLDYCGVCSSTRKALADFPARYAQRVAVRTLLHLEPEAQKAVKRYAFDSHGLVLHAGDRLVYRAADHRVRLSDLTVAIERELRAADAAAGTPWFASWSAGPPALLTPNAL